MVKPRRKSDNHRGQRTEKDSRKQDGNPRDRDVKPVTKIDTAPFCDVGRDREGSDDRKIRDRPPGRGKSQSESNRSDHKCHYQELQGGGKRRRALRTSLD